MNIDLQFPESTYKGWSIKSFIEDGRDYQCLISNGKVMMLNSNEIVADFEDFLSKAEGHVLINGLGIGMCIVHLLKKTSIKSLTVVEFDCDLVTFMTPFFEEDRRCQIVCADAFQYHPPEGKVYDFVWHDIWTIQKASNHVEINRLKSKYERIACWQGAWREKEVKKQYEELSEKMRP